MNKFMTSRNLTIINFIIVLYFALIWLINFYQIEHVLIGVFGELLTIPFLIAQVVFLIIGIKYLIKHERRFLLIVSVALLAVSTVFTLKDFF